MEGDPTAEPASGRIAIRSVALWLFYLFTVYSPKTYSMDAVDMFLSSGACGMMLFGCREPTNTATYCLPFAA
jgi:hypothetical protein